MSSPDANFSPPVDGRAKKTFRINLAIKIESDLHSDRKTVSRITNGILVPRIPFASTVKKYAWSSSVKVSNNMKEMPPTLFQLYLSARTFELLLHLFSLFLRNAFFHRLRQFIHQSFGVLEAKSGNSSNLFDHLNFFVACRR